MEDLLSFGSLGFIIVMLILVFIIFEYNSIRTLKNKVYQSRSGIDIALTKRFDLIPNLVECVKGYCAYEEKVLTEVIKVRSEYLSSKNLNLGEITNNKCQDVLLLAEKYPSLKANEQFESLQISLQRTENSLAAARRLYNSDVTLYNTKIKTFPGNIIAGLMGAKEERFFEAEKIVNNNVNVKI